MLQVITRLSAGIARLADYAVGQLWSDPLGALWVRGETYSHVTPSLALATSAVIANAAGHVHSLVASVDASAPTSTYYAVLLDATSLPADGAYSTPPLVVVSVDHVSGTRNVVNFRDNIGAGLWVSTGCVLVLSSTLATLTHVATPYLLVQSGEVGP